MNGDEAEVFQNQIVSKKNKPIDDDEPVSKKKTKKTSQKSKQNHQSPKHHQLTLRKNQQIPTTTTPPLPHPGQKEINRNRQNIRVRSQHSPPPQTTNHPPRS